MSGGSYNYLFLHTRGLEEQRGDIEAMRDRLQELDHPGAVEAARRTEAVLTVLDVAELTAQTLAGVWKAVEWWDSSDYGEDQVRDALAEYQENS